MLSLPIVTTALLYSSGYIAQFVRNYRLWQAGGGTLYSGTSPKLPDPAFFQCLLSVFHFPDGLYGLAICTGLLALLVFSAMRMGRNDAGEYDKTRYLVYSENGTHGTAGFMSRQER